MLLNITGGMNMTLKEVQKAAGVIAESVDPDANIIFGMVTDPKMEDEICVTIIATGLPSIERMSLNDDSIAEFLRRAISDEADFDLPPFLRASRPVDERVGAAPRIAASPQSARAVPLTARRARGGASPGALRKRRNRAPGRSSGGLFAFGGAKGAREWQGGGESGNSGKSPFLRPSVRRASAQLAYI